MTQAQLITKINTLIKQNGIEAITGDILNEVLLDMLNISGSSIPIFGPVQIITNIHRNLGTLANGSVVNGVVLATNDIFVPTGQADPTENGIYTIGENAGDTARHADFPDAASCANKIIISENPDENGSAIASLTLDGNGDVQQSVIPVSQELFKKWTPLTIATDFTSTPASTSTITALTDQTANIKAGMAAKYKIGGTYYFGVYDAVASDLFTIGGIALSGDITELYYSPLAGQCEMFAVGVPGVCLAAASTTLIETFNKQKAKLDKTEGYCVQISTWSRVDDSGAVQPHVNVLNGSGAPICSSNAGAGLEVAETWVKTTINIDPDNYLITNQSAIELATDGIGSNGDAEDVTVQFLIVYP